MKIFVCLLAMTILNLSMADLSSSGWKAFKNRHGKNFSNTNEEQHRYSIWYDNSNQISLHNKRFALGLESYQKGFNMFSDMTYEEFASKYTGSRQGVVNGGHQSRSEVESGSARALPASVDYRKTGYVGVVKNQGSCGYLNSLNKKHTK